MIAKVTASLPEEVKRFTWVRNHHFVELEDKEGNKTTLYAGGLLIGDCQDCHMRVPAFQHMGFMCCPHCKGSVVWQWNRPQLAFVPEKVSDFVAPDVKKG